MGYVKDLKLAQEAAGFHYLGAEEACPGCIANECLAARVADAATPGDCDFCGAMNTTTVALHDLFALMATSIRHEYEPSSTSDQVPVGSDRDLEMPTLDGAKLLDQLGNPLGHERLAEVFAESFEEVVDAEHWTGTLDERLVWGWQHFADELRSRTRFVFWRTPRSGGAGPVDIEPADMLDELEQVIRTAGLIIPFPKGQACFRGRKHAPHKVLATPQQLGPPPAHDAVSMRMSPPGIPMFYGATNEATALAELRGVAGEVATVGEWITVRDCHIVDFVRLPTIPSIFCHEEVPRRPYLRFVQRFVEEITRPVLAHDHPSIDYVPTQAVADYIRHCVKTDLGGPIDGVLYPSAMHAAGSNIAFFVSPEDLAGRSPLLALVELPKRHVAKGMTTTWKESALPEDSGSSALN